MATLAASDFEVVRECSEWEKMHEMEERIHELACGEQRLEERLAQRFGFMMSDLVERLEVVEAKVDMLGPMTQSLSMSQIDAQMEIERLDATINEMQYPEDMQMSLVGDAIATIDATLQELQKKVNGSLAPMMQSFAFAQMDNLACQQDTTAKLQEIDSAHLKVGCSMDDLKTEMQTKLKSLEDSLHEMAAQQVQKAVRKEAASQTPAQAEAASPSRVPACMLDVMSQDAAPQTASDSPHGGLLTPFEQALMCGSFSKRATHSKQNRPSSQARSPEKEARQDGLGSKSGTKKAHRSEAQHDWTDALSVPFAPTGSTIGFRTLERTSGSRSLPYLPPMF